MRPSLDAPSKRFAHALALAIEARCVTFRDYIPWADAQIARVDHPPIWICNLSTTKYLPDALRVIREFVHSEPFEDVSGTATDYLGFLWIRYGRRELSWATFLNESGAYCDGSNAEIDCEYFYGMLNELEEAEFCSEVEARQSEHVKQRLGEMLARTRDVYERFRNRG